MQLSPCHPESCLLLTLIQGDNMSTSSPKRKCRCRAHSARYYITKPHVPPHVPGTPLAPHYVKGVHWFHPDWYRTEYQITEFTPSGYWITPPDSQSLWFRSQLVGHANLFPVHRTLKEKFHDEPKPRAIITFTVIIPPQCKHHFRNLVARRLCHEKFEVLNHHRGRDYVKTRTRLAPAITESHTTVNDSIV